MRKNITCTICPLGCRIRVAHSKDAIQRIEDYQCERGKDYAVHEVFNPMRTLTTTLRVKNGELPLVSVKVSKPVPKESLIEIMDAIAHIEVEAPLAIGEVLVEGVLGLDADIVATKHVRKI